MGLNEDKIGRAMADPDNAGLTRRERLALRYAELLYFDPGQVDGAFYAEMRDHFTEAEIVELGIFSGLQIGGVKFMATLDVKHGELAAPAASE